MSLAVCTRLAKLVLASLPELASLEGLPSSIEEMEVSMALIQDLGPLAACARLRELTLRGLAHLQNLGGLPASLKVLKLADCEDVTSLALLAACTGLQSLICLALPGLTSLVGLPSDSLTALTLADCPIHDLQPLAPCTRLTHLQLVAMEQLISLHGLPPSLVALVCARCLSLGSLALAPVLEACPILNNLMMQDLGQRRAGESGGPRAQYAAGRQAVEQLVAAWELASEAQHGA